MPIEDWVDALRAELAAGTGTSIWPRSPRCAGRRAAPAHPGLMMFVGTENTGDGDAVSCTSPRPVRPMTRWPTSPKR
jgi:hypothetical protein